MTTTSGCVNTNVVFEIHLAWVTWNLRNLAIIADTSISDSFPLWSRSYADFYIKVNNIYVNNIVTVLNRMVFPCMFHHGTTYRLTTIKRKLRDNCMRRVLCGSPLCRGPGHTRGRARAESQCGHWWMLWAPGGCFAGHLSPNPRCTYLCAPQARAEARP